MTIRIERKRMFVLAHLSDPHIGPLPRPRLADLASKRMVGYVNWLRGRSRAHRLDTLDALTRALAAQAHDHTAVTGDLVNIALPAEFATAQAWLDRLGNPADVTFVPGNHDAYVRAALPYWDKHWEAFMQGDEEAARDGARVNILSEYGVTPARIGGARRAVKRSADAAVIGGRPPGPGTNRARRRTSAPARR